MKKYYTTAQKGSALLLVFGIVTILTLCFTSAFYNTTRLLDIVYKREQYSQRMHATEGILNYAIAFVSTHYTLLQMHAQNGDKDIDVHFDQWPVADGKKNYYGKAHIIMRKKDAALQAILYQDTHQIGKISCQISPDSNNSLVVSEWHSG